MPRCDSGLSRDTQNGMGTTGNFFERPPAQGGLSSTIFNNSKNLASLFSGIEAWSCRNCKEEKEREREREIELKRESLNTSIPLLHIQSGGGMLNHTGGTCSHSGLMDYPRFSISQMHLGTFPGSMEFQSWKVNFKSEVCLRTADPQITMHWIKEVEIAKSIDELVTSRSIVGHAFPDFEMLDAMIASALKKLLNTQTHFRKRVSVEEQRARKHDRFLRGRQIACMIYEYFRATAAYEAVQGPSDLLTITLQHDDVQDFDVRWDQAILPVSEMPSDMILEGLYKSKITEFCSTSECDGIV